MIRRLFTVASALSLVLSLQAAALWVRSNWGLCPLLVFARGGHLYRVSTSAGKLELDNAPQLEIEETLERQREAAVLKTQKALTNISRRMDESGLYTVGGPFSGAFISAGYQPRPPTPAEVARNEQLTRELEDAQQVVWGLTMLRSAAAPPPAKMSYSIACRSLFFVVVAMWIAVTLCPFMLRRRQCSRRTKLRLCLGCGFDLRASTGRCPECGMSITSNVGANA